MTVYEIKKFRDRHGFYKELPYSINLDKEMLDTKNPDNSYVIGVLVDEINRLYAQRDFPKWHDIRKELPDENLEVILLDKKDNIFRGIANKNGKANQTYPLTIDFWMYPEDFERILPKPNGENT